MSQPTVDTLYKYGAISAHSEAFLSTPTLYHAAPPQLNNPFECRPWLTFNGNRDEVVESFTRLFRKFEGLTHNEATARAVGVYLERRHEDPRNWEALRRDVIRLLANKIGICCFSRVPDSILMWSHYGVNHTGFCVEFEATDHTPVFGAAQRVMYCDTYPVVDFFKTPNDEQGDLLFLTKFSGWAYEQEWRIIDHDSGPGVREYPAGLMKSITFGLRMPNEAKLKIKEWVARRVHTVKLFQASQHDRRFAIELIEAS